MKRENDPLPPIFENIAICMACGREKHVNTCGFCEECWVTYAHFRKPQLERREERAEW